MEYEHLPPPGLRQASSAQDHVTIYYSRFYLVHTTREGFIAAGRRPGSGKDMRRQRQNCLRRQSSDLDNKRERLLILSMPAGLPRLFSAAWKNALDLIPICEMITLCSVVAFAV